MSKNDKHIYIDTFLHQKKSFVPTGVITFDETTNYSSFTYFDSYIKDGLPSINPSTLNWKKDKNKTFIVNETINSQMLDKTFWEMIPSEEDWGHIVLSKRYPEYDYLNYVQKLYFLEKRVVGGLDAYLNNNSTEENIIGEDWLEQVRDESIDFFMQRIEKISHIRAINPLSSYGGVRPKCMFEDDNGEFWIAKFNLPTDDYDFAIAEQVSLDMARDVGLPCAESKVITLPSGEHVFLSKRFDRNKKDRNHSLSLFSLIPEEKIKNKNASVISDLISQYSDFENQDSLNFVVKNLLDIGIHNTDNHLRNIRLILNENDKWQISPFYDITFSTIENNHTYLPLDMEIENLYLANPNIVEETSKKYNVSEVVVSEKLLNIFSVLENWEYYCQKNGMTQEDMFKIGNTISKGMYKKIINKKSSSEIKNANIPKLTPIKK